jgi:YVTN family beta-propeller protein
MKRVWLHVCTAVSVLLMALILVPLGNRSVALADDDDLPRGEFIPTGVHITPTAAKGSSFQPLNPGLPSDPTFTAGQAVTTAISPDSRTLLILTSGYNSQNFTSGPKEGQTNPAESSEYVFVYDISSPKPLLMQVLQVANAYDGLAWNPNGKEFYVSGGPDDNVHFFIQGGGKWTEDAKGPVALGHPALVALGGIKPAAAGIGVTADGKKLVVANYEHDSVSVLDVATRTKSAELDLRPGKINPSNRGIPGGEFPFWVAIQGNTTAFVTSERDREVVVVNIATPVPFVNDRIALKGQPTRLILSPSQKRLYVAESSSDAVAVISTKTRKILEEINTTAPQKVFANSLGFKGSSPNSLAVSADGEWLYVTNSGANSVAVIQLAHDAEGDSDDHGGSKGEVKGAIPTGWYPNSVSVSADGSRLYVVNGKSNAGPNPQNCRDKGSLAFGHGIGAGAENACNAANQYVWQLTKAGFLTLPVPRGDELEDLTEQVAQNNQYRRDRDHDRDEKVMAALREKVQHVIYIVRENRTYDQILGDLGKGNGDPAITVYPQPITPNQHALANRFVDLDNFYDSGEVSGDGWNWSVSARAADTIEKTEPINYAGRGLNYDYEGTNRNVNVGYSGVAARQAANPVTPSDPDLLPGTADVSAPDAPDSDDAAEGAGYLWDSALRSGLSVRNYGFFIDLARYSSAVGPAKIPLLRDPFASSTTVSYATKAALQPITDQYFRGYDNAFPDFYRVSEWEREFRQFEANGDLPNLEFVRVMHDHTGSFGSAIDDVNTPEIQTADNDYAVGRIVDIVSHSANYKDNTVVFVVEDDAQDGPDHVDAHRSIAYIAGAYVKQGAVVSRKFTTVSMIATIVDILGMGHLGLNDADAEPMADCFQPSKANWTFNAIVPTILKTSTTLPLPISVKKVVSPKRESVDARFSKPLHDGSWWAAQTVGFDFSVEDRVNPVVYNPLLWKGIMGDSVPYPAARSGLDLRHNRKQLLRNYWKAQETQLAPLQPSEGAKVSLVHASATGPEL